MPAGKPRCCSGPAPPTATQGQPLSCCSDTEPPRASPSPAAAQVLHHQGQPRASLSPVTVVSAQDLHLPRPISLLLLRPYTSQGPAVSSCSGPTPPRARPSPPVQTLNLQGLAPLLLLRPYTSQDPPLSCSDHEPPRARPSLLLRPYTSQGRQSIISTLTTHHMCCRRHNCGTEHTRQTWRNTHTQSEGSLYTGQSMLCCCHHEITHYVMICNFLTIVNCTFK